MANRLVENDGLVESLQHALHSGEVGLSLVPPLVKRVIEEERWHERYVRVIREEARFDRFVDFVEATPPEGLGADLPLVERLCADDPEALRLIRAATVNPKGKHRVRITNMSKANSDDASYVLSRLHGDRPDLYHEVVAKRMSPHAAAKQAGYRKPYASVRTDDPAKVAAFLAKHFAADEIRRIADLAVRLREGP
jgi:hypothetical protein